METHREPNVTDSMLHNVDTGVTISFPTYTDGNSDSRHCFTKPCILVFIIIGVVLVGLVIVIVAVAKKDTNILQTNSEQLEDLLNATRDYENTTGKEEPTDVNNIAAQLFTCVYNTPTDFLEKLNKDPFGDKCRLGSNYVLSKCNNTDGQSTQNCIDCEVQHNSKIPNFCLCDNITQCGNYDAFGKKECKDCLDYFQRSPYKERGICSCSNLFMIQCSCSCHEGFSNLMCSSIEKRICKYRFEKKETIDSCFESNDDTCVLKDCASNELICELFNEGNKDLRKNADTCEIFNSNNTECIWTESTKTEQGRNNKLSPAATIFGNNSDTCEPIFANVLTYAFLCAMLAQKLNLY